MVQAPVSLSFGQFCEYYEFKCQYLHFAEELQGARELGGESICEELGEIITRSYVKKTGVT